MKTLALLLLLGITSCTAYLYAYNPIIELVGLNHRMAPLEAGTPSVDVPATMMAIPEPPPLPAPPGSTAMKSPVTEPSVATVPAMTPTPSPVVPLASMTESAPKPDADGFVPPKFLPLEEVVKNWTQVPVTAFPRQIRVMKPVEFITVLSGGNKMSSKVPAGSLVQAVAQEGSMLVISISTSVPARAEIAMDDTDFKAVLMDAYEHWKVATTERARRAHLAGIAARERAASISKDGAAAAGAPVRNAEGTYDILLASMKAGKVTDITPQNVRKWSDPVREERDGKVSWSITVDVTVQTAFGPIDTQAVAHLRDGKVEKWLYISGEEVP